MNNTIKHLDNGDFEVEKPDIEIKDLRFLKLRGPHSDYLSQVMLEEAVIGKGVSAKTDDGKNCSCDCGGCAKGFKSK